MGQLTEAQRKWLQGLGIDAAAAGEPDAAAAPTDVPLSTGAASAGDAWTLDPTGGQKPAPFKLPRFDQLTPDQKDAILKGLDEQKIIDKKQAEETLARMNQLLGEAKTFIDRMSSDEVGKASYVMIMSEVRKRYPELANLSQWVKETARKVPELKGKLPSQKALMNTVEGALKARFADLGWAVSTGKNLASVNSDRLLAAYMSELPAGVSIGISGGVVQLTLEGAALAVATPAGDVDAKVGKAGAAVSLKNNDYAIQVENSGWKDFDPELRGEWKKIEGDAKTLLTLRATRDEAKATLEKSKGADEKLTADLTAKFKEREAEFNLAWQKLNERITAQAKASEQKISASVAYLKKDKNDKDALKAGLEAEVDLKAMQGKLKAYFANPDLDAVFEITASAEKVTATLELKAVKSGAVVTAKFEKALDETKVAIEAMLRDGKTQIAAELKKEADDLSAKLKVVHETKDLKLAAELEKTLTEVRGSIEVAYTKGNTTLKGGAKVGSGGEAGGSVQIDIALKDGRTFMSDGDKLSFTANVSNKGYKFEVAFSMGEPVETGSLQDIFASADRQIKELYKLAGDKGVRSIEDAKALNDKLQEVMAPIKQAADKAKTLKKKSEIAASFGFSIQGDWPAGGKASPPAAMFGFKLTF